MTGTGVLSSTGAPVLFSSPVFFFLPHFSTQTKQCDKTTIKAFVKKAIAAGRIPAGRSYSAQAILNRLGLANGEYLANAGETLFCSFKSRSAAVGAGYSPCEDCN